MKLAELFITLGLDPGEFEKGVQDAIKESNKLKTQTSKDAQSIGSVWKNALSVSVGNLWSRGVSAAVSMMGKMAKQGIAMASDLEEVQNVVDKTFTKMSASIDTWAKSAMSSFGMGELAAKQYVSTMGAMLKSMGLSETEFFDMSTALTRLAGDMASFYNLDHEDAFNKIRSGISGETEPLKQLGINMSVANLEAFALAEGIEKAYNQMSQSEQVMLRYNYLMNATSDAQGDFAQTIDSYANQSRLLSENWDKLWTNIGSLFTPALTSALESINSLFGTEKGKTTATVLTESFKESSAQISVTHVRADALIGVLAELEAAGVDTADEQLRWNTALEELQELLPGISSLIDQETNSIIGGTNALKEYNEEWKKNAITAGKMEYVEDLYKGYGSKIAEEAELQAQYDIAGAQLLALWNNQEEEKTRIINRIDEQVGKMKDQSTKDIWSLIKSSGWTDAVVQRMLYPESSNEGLFKTNLKTGIYNGVSATDEQAETVLGFTDVFSQKNYPLFYTDYNAIEEEVGKVSLEKSQAWADLQKAKEEIDDYERRIKNLDVILEEDADLTEEQSAAYRNVASAITTAADAMKDATDGWFDAEPAMEENITLTEEMVEAYTSMAESVIKAVDSMASGWGRAERVGTQSARTTVRNLKSQLDQLNQYNEQLDILRDSGYFSEEMLAMLASGGAENMAVTAGFAKEVQRAQKGNASSVENLEAASSYYEQLAAAKADLAETMLEMKLTVDEDSLSGAIVTGMSGLALNVNVNASALADALTPFISANIARDNTTSGKTGG